MIRCVPPVPIPQRSFCFAWTFRLGFVVFALSLISHQAAGYVLNGKTWPSGTITFQMGLGSPASPLSDGSSNWNAAAQPAFATWNQKIQRIQLAGVMDVTPPVASGDRVNSVVFSNSVFGQSFGSNTLAVTYYMMSGSNMTEADVLLNRAQTFDSYRGNLRFAGSGYAIADIRRVFVHELGHGIGLNHSSGDNIMDPVTGNREALSGDDIAGAQAMYGAPSAPPPTSPSPTPAPATGRLANISTRMKVGTGSDVLIGGFIIQGTQAKSMILRAIGPSLTAGGVVGAMQNPTLEIRNSGGALVASNDDWQSNQAGQISATGVAPSHPNESAIVATLQPGAYTAIVQGVNNTQGVALVEGYELDSSATRLVNLSTRGRIGVGDEVLIGGLIVQGSGRKVLVRALGPSLEASVSGALADPVLEIYNSAGQLIASNDNWSASAQKSELVASTLPPTNSAESAIVTTLAAGSYTAIVHGANGTTGVGLLEVYDLEP